MNEPDVVPCQQVDEDADSLLDETDAMTTVGDEDMEEDGGYGMSKKDARAGRDEIEVC